MLTDWQEFHCHGVLYERIVVYGDAIYVHGRLLGALSEAAMVGNKQTVWSPKHKTSIGSEIFAVATTVSRLVLLCRKNVGEESRYFGAL
jgi:hypothetical protein